MSRPQIVRILSWVLMLTVVAAGVALILVPKAVGGRPLTVLSGSMTGTYDIGDVVIVKPVDTDGLGVGDVITFQAISDDPTLTTHRIVALAFGSDGKQFVTQGDANGAPDLAPVKPEQVRGEVWYSVPKVGYVATSMAAGWLRTITDAGAVLLLLYGGWTIATGLADRIRRRSRAHGVAPTDTGPRAVADSREVVA